MATRKITGETDVRRSRACAMVLPEGMVRVQSTTPARAVPSSSVLASWNSGGIGAAHSTGHTHSTSAHVNGRKAISGAHAYGTSRT